LQYLRLLIHDLIFSSDVNPLGAAAGGSNATGGRGTGAVGGYSVSRGAAEPSELRSWGSGRRVSALKKLRNPMKMGTFKYEKIFAHPH